MSALARPLLDGVAAALRADAGLAALVGERIYGEAFAGAVFPYVTLGPWKAQGWGSGDGRGEDITFAVSAVARKSRSQAMAATEAVSWVLDAEPVVLAGARLVALRFVEAEAVQAKGDVWRATARFRALVEAA